MSTTAVAGKKHTFTSRGREERLVRRPLHITQDSFGQQHRQQEPVRYLFGPHGTLEVYEGQDLLPDGPPEFNPETGRMEPTVQDAVAWLDSHALLNTRFWHDGHEPGRLLPTEQDFMALVTDAAVTLAEEPLLVALEQEHATHKRPLLIQAAEGTLEKVRAMRAQIAEQEAAAESSGG